MMGGGTFILLKAGLLGPKRANQAEDSLAVLPAIFGIARLQERSAAAKAEGIPVADFYATWLIRKIDRFCYLDQLAQHPAAGSHVKMIQVFISKTMQHTTYQEIDLFMQLFIHIAKRQA